MTTNPTPETTDAAPNPPRRRRVLRRIQTTRVARLIPTLGEFLRSSMGWRLKPRLAGLRPRSRPTAAGSQVFIQSWYESEDGPRDLHRRRSRRVPAGLSAARMTADQRRALLALIAARIGIANEAARRLALIAADLDRTRFAWAGPTEAGGAAYWRVAGPTIHIEYAPQRFRSGEPDAGHIHAIYRDPTDDYSDGWLGGMARSLR